MADKIKQAVIYTRFSPRKNAETCESLETQLELCTHYCQCHQMQIVGTYEDEALSGKCAVNRPGLQDAIEHAIRIKGVLVFRSISRLARSSRDALAIAEKINKAGAFLCSVKESFDTTTPFGMMFYTILAAFAQLDRAMIADTTRDAMRRHQKTGRRMSSIYNLPYGWRLDPDDPARMVRDEYEQEVIEEIKWMREPGKEEVIGRDGLPEWEEVRGLTLREIATELDETGFTPRKRWKTFKGKKVEIVGKWHFGQIRRILERLARDEESD